MNFRPVCDLAELTLGIFHELCVVDLPVSFAVLSIVLRTSMEAVSPPKCSSINLPLLGFC